MVISFFQHWIFFLSSSGRIAPLLRGGEMNEVVNSGVMNIASLVVSVVVLLIGLILWFFINRASSRTNEQIELLEALLDQQKRQNALLRRLCEANEPEKADKKTVESQKSVEDEDIIRLVAER
ncbi:yebO [Escherichia coli O25b:H4]|nr:yebO [Escherichia coli O25b:H4]